MAASEGPSVDKDSQPVIDPTANVRELVIAAIQRQDDLRGAMTRLRESELKRIDDKLTSEHDRVTELMELRAEHARDLTAAETKRIDAIRAVDVAAVAIANERATAQATVLANQVAASAETLRALVATTATASQQQATASFSQLSDRITLLERTSYEGSGKSAVVDPQMARIMTQMEALTITMSKGEGRAGLSQPLLMLVAAGIGGLVLFLIETLMRAPGVVH